MIEWIISAGIAVIIFGIIAGIAFSAPTALAVLFGPCIFIMFLTAVVRVVLFGGK